MDLQLKGKTAVVTGGTRGIGRAIADCFADEGANVAICARNAEQVADAVKALEAKGVKAFGQVVDIADGPALQAFITRAGETLGGIDVLVSNASALVQGNGEDAWKAMFEIDMLGAVRTFEAAKPFLEKAAAANGDAAFIITSSVSAAEADNPSSYGAMKAALIHYAKGVAREGAPKQVRCNVVSPGPIFVEGGDWNKIKDNMAAFYEATEKLHPQGALGTVQDVANVVAFLASDAARHVNGVNVTVDGGFLKRIDF